MNRNTSFDTFKAVAAFFIIILHCANVQGGEIYSVALKSIARFGVPFFFMITGYFLTPMMAKRREVGYCLKIGKITIISTLFYLVECSLVYSMESNNTIMAGAKEFLSTTFSLSSVAKWLFICMVPFGYHLWYLYALLLSLVVVIIVCRSLNRNRNLIILSTAAILSILFFNYSGFLSPVVTRSYITGIPCLAIGLWTYNYGTIIKGRFNY